MDRSFLKSMTAQIAVVMGLIVTACDMPATSVEGPIRESDGSSTIPAVHVMSNRSDLISGGDALVDIVLGDNLSPGEVLVTLESINVTDAFQPVSGGRIRGLISGIPVGWSTLVVQHPGGSVVTKIKNHPSGGPVFAGPQLQPWTCSNEGAVDSSCNQPPEYRFLYKSSVPGSSFREYDPENPPSNVAETTTDDGITVPFIVREEKGYIDRDQYRIAVLFRPGAPWTAIEPQDQFNHKVLINHGAACGVDFQSADAPDVLSEAALSRGFAVMSTALSNAGHNCNVALQAESLMMTKEHLIERYGLLRYTIGAGCSGGSLAIQTVANAYPGIYQGILPTCSFPDAWSTATQFLDYHLTLEYFQNPFSWGLGIVWLPHQMAEVQGHLTIVNSIVSDTAQYQVAVPTHACDGVSEEQRYHPENNPEGVRCTVQDAAINLLGPRPPEVWSAIERRTGKGFAGFPVDNIGVQYGLRALRMGIISPAQFLDLNDKIGGADHDANVVSARMVAVEPALSNAYRTGLINVANNLDKTPIIDCRGPDPALFHDSYRAFAIRARLDEVHGGHPNHVIWQGPVPLIGDLACADNSLIAMDRWLKKIESDSRDAPLALKVSENKPTDVADACFSGVGMKISEGLCSNLIVPVYGTPRTVAGDSVATLTNKCELRPLDRLDDYGPLPFSDSQWNQMEALFPDGVCDYSKAGISEQPTIPWQTYQDENGQVVYGGTQLPKVEDRSGEGWASASFLVFSD